MLKLNLGCGYDIRPKPWVNIDQYLNPGVDVVCDLEKCQLPFKDASADEVDIFHVLEHVLRWESLVMEIHRVLVPDGVLNIKVPFKSMSAYHVRLFDDSSLEFLYEDQRCFFQDEKHNGLQPFPKFSLVQKKRAPKYWYNYHFKKYLHKDWSVPWGVGELSYVLKKRVS